MSTKWFQARTGNSKTSSLSDCSFLCLTCEATSPGVSSAVPSLQAGREQPACTHNLRTAAGGERGYGRAELEAFCVPSDRGATGAWGGRGRGEAWWEKRGRGGEAALGARGGGQEEHRRTLRLTSPPAGPARHRHRGLLGPAPCSARRPRPDSSLGPTALLLGHVPKHAARSAVSAHHPFSPSRCSPNPRMALQWEAKG